MDHLNNEAGVIEFGAASVETKGSDGPKPELGGLQPETGISDD